MGNGGWGMVEWKALSSPFVAEEMDADADGDGDGDRE